MTDAQLKRLYFPAWNAAKAACWRWEKGRLTRVGNPTPWTERVEAVARQLAGPEHRGLTADDLRHAGNALAIRRARAHRARLPEDAVPLDLRPVATSSEAFNDRHDLALGLFVALCDLLVDETCLGHGNAPGGLIAWDHPENLERHYMLRVIERRCAPGYVARMCREMFGTSDPASLEPDVLADFYRTLGQRKNAWLPAGRRAPVQPTQPEGVECPF